MMHNHGGRWCEVHRFLCQEEKPGGYESALERRTLPCRANPSGVEAPGKNNTFYFSDLFKLNTTFERLQFTTPRVGIGGAVSTSEHPRGAANTPSTGSPQPPSYRGATPRCPRGLNPRQRSRTRKPLTDAQEGSTSPDGRLRKKTHPDGG